MKHKDLKMKTKTEKSIASVTRGTKSNSQRDVSLEFWEEFHGWGECVFQEWQRRV